MKVASRNWFLVLLITVVAAGSVGTSAINHPEPLSHQLEHEEEQQHGVRSTAPKAHNKAEEEEEVPAAEFVLRLVAPPPLQSQSQPEEHPSQEEQRRLQIITFSETLGEPMPFKRTKDALKDEASSEEEDEASKDEAASKEAADEEAASNEAKDAQQKEAKIEQTFQQLGLFRFGDQDEEGADAEAAMLYRRNKNNRKPTRKPTRKVRTYHSTRWIQQELTVK